MRRAGRRPILSFSSSYLRTAREMMRRLFPRTDSCEKAVFSFLPPLFFLFLFFSVPVDGIGRLGEGWSQGVPGVWSTFLFSFPLFSSFFPPRPALHWGRTRLSAPSLPFFPFFFFFPFPFPPSFLFSWDYRPLMERRNY